MEKLLFVPTQWVNENKKKQLTSLDVVTTPCVSSSHHMIVIEVRHDMCHWSGLLADPPIVFFIKWNKLPLKCQMFHRANWTCATIFLGEKYCACRVDMETMWHFSKLNLWKPLKLAFLRITLLFKINNIKEKLRLWVYGNLQSRRKCVVIGNAKLSLRSHNKWLFAKTKFLA